MERVLNEILDRLSVIEKDIRIIKERYNQDTSTESDVRDFAINVAANIVGNAIKTPTFLNIR